MSDYGVKTALPDKDITTSSNKDIAFSSQYPLFKVAKEGIATIVGNNTVQTLRISHYLGYLPGFLVTSNGFTLRGITSRVLLDYNTQGSEHSFVTSDTQDLIINAYVATGDTAVIKYYIFIDEGV